MELKDKTQQQQQEHAEFLHAVKNIIGSEGLTALLTGSALLGAHRDKDLIPWCWGAVLTVFTSELTDVKKENLIKKLKDSGYKIKKYYSMLKNFKIRIDKGPYNIEITGYNYRPGQFYRTLKRKEKVIPENLLLPPYSKIRVRGYKFTCPHCIESFLSFIYLDWKTVIRSARPAEYKSKLHMVNK